MTDAAISELLDCLNKEELAEFIQMGFDQAARYWCNVVNPDGTDFESFFAGRGSFVIEEYGESQGEVENTYRFERDAFMRMLILVAIEHYVDNADVFDADRVVQLAVLGEERYG